MTRAEWCAYHGITEDESLIIEGWRIYYGGQITEVHQSTFSQRYNAANKRPSSEILFIGKKNFGARSCPR